MKYKNLLFIAGIAGLFFFASCSPIIYYMGDSYASSSSVEVYYDIKEIKKEYKIIGRMVKEVTLRTETDKRQMINEAKKRGADAIVFSDILLSDKKQSDQVSVKAELIKYVD